jgi:hypothetical protein
LKPLSSHPGRSTPVHALPDGRLGKSALPGPIGIKQELFRSIQPFSQVGRDTDGAVFFPLCPRAPFTVTKYHKRIFGPLLDRIDIHI